MPMCRDEAPAVSVILGSWYRREELGPLRRSVESILAQSFTDYELLICAEGSSRAAMEYLRSLSARDGRVRLVGGVRSGDLAERLNLCLGQARGRLIARMDDDDYSAPERFARQLDYLEAQPETAFVGCCVSLYRSGLPVGCWRFPERPQIRDFYIRQPFIHPTLIFRREALEAVGGYSEEKRCLKCEDYDLLLRLYGRGFFGANLQDETLFAYTLPETARGSRTMKDRFRESRTRWLRFRELGLLPKALPYVLKPVAAGLLPEKLLGRVKEKKIYV